MEKYISKRKDSKGMTIYFITKTSCCNNRVEWHRGSSYEQCPHCGDNYYKKPNLENKLFNLQDEFIADFNLTGSTRILGEKMFPLIHEYAENLIKAMIKGKKSLDYEELSTRAWDAATLLIEVIMKDSEHKMRYSFGKYLSDLCKSVCYSTKNHEHTLSLNMLLKNRKMSLEETIIVEIDSLINEYTTENEIKINNSFEMNNFKEDVICKLINLIEKTVNILFEITESYIDKLLYLQGLLIKFKHEDDKLISNFFEEAGKSIKNYIEKGELIIFSELEEMTT